MDYSIYVKFRLPLFLILTALSVSSMSAMAFGQMQDHNNMDNSPEKMISKFLEGEDTSKFETTHSGTKPLSYFGGIYNAAKNNLLIKSGTEVTLGGEPISEFSTILVEGTMRITDTATSTLKVQKIIIGPTGKLIIGTDNAPINNKVEIVFVKNKPSEIGIFNFGELSVIGANVSPTFVQLVSDAKPNESVLNVSHIVNSWHKGDKIVITTPGYRYEDPCSTEESEISSVNGVVTGLKNPLRCFHSGSSKTGDEYGQYSHVSLLSRNIVFKSQDVDNRGSVNFFYNSTGTIKYAEFRGLGQKDTIGRYPIHFHRMEDTSRGIQVVGNAIVNSDNRWITIHDSNGIIVKDNVGYKSIGHGFFFEDGTEFDNVFENNIGIYTIRGDLINSDGAASVFWTQNPKNVFRNNIAISGFYYGFYFQIPNKLVKIPKSEDTENLRSLAPIEFDKNQGYNNRHSGLNIIRIMEKNSKFDMSIYNISNFVVLNESIGPDETFGGIIITGNNILINNARIYDSVNGIVLKGNNNTVSKTKIVYHLNDENRIPMSGIVIGGKDNNIKESEITGYVSNSNDLSSDISLLVSVYDQISATINNTKLFDSRPILFGLVHNIDSFLQIYNYDVFNGKKNEYPKNFILKRIDYDIVKGTEKKHDINLNSFAIVVQIENLDMMNTSNQKIRPSQSTYKSALIPEWIKNNANLWCKGKNTNSGFNHAVQFLIENKFISIPETYDSGKISEVIPQWAKNNACRWSNNQISDLEFIESIQYVIDQKVS